MPPRTPSEHACLVRLQEMDAALAQMERELPDDDARSLGSEARRRVADWLQRLAAGDASLEQLGEAMNDLSGLVDALAERLVRGAWDPPEGQDRN